MSNLSFNEPIKLTGHLTIDKIDAAGNIITLLDDKNLIVLSGRNAIVSMLAGQIVSSAINDIAFGTDGVLPTNSSVAKAVSPSDTTVNKRIENLVNGVDYFFSVATMSTTTAPKLVVSVTVPKDNTALNGEDISELALMMSSLAFSIKRFPSIPKSDTFHIVISWRIYA